MAYLTKFHYEIETMSGETVKGEGEHKSWEEFPDLAENWDGVYKIIERHSHELIRNLNEFGTEQHRVEFKAEAKRKGWKMQDIAKRWSITPRRLSQIAKDPRCKDWDALDGLPAFNPDILVL